MPRSARQSPALFSDLIILVVMVFTAAMAMLSPGFALGSSRAFEFYAALAAYAFLAILAVRRLFSGDEWWRDCAYFGLQLALFGVLVALRVDAIWLLSMPVVSQASLRLRVPALAAVTVAYLVMFCILFPSESWTWSSRLRARRLGRHFARLRGWKRACSEMRRSGVTAV